MQVKLPVINQSFYSANRTARSQSSSIIPSYKKMLPSKQQFLHVIKQQDYNQLKTKQIQQEHDSLLDIISRYNDYLTNMLQRRKSKPLKNNNSHQNTDNLLKLKSNNQRIIGKYQLEIKELSAQTHQQDYDLRQLIFRSKSKIDILDKQIKELKRLIKFKERQIISNQKSLTKQQGRLHEQFMYQKKYNEILLQKKAKLDLMSRDIQPRRSHSLSTIKRSPLGDKQKQYQTLIETLERKKRTFQKNYQSKRKAIILMEETMRRQQRTIAELKL